MRQIEIAVYMSPYEAKAFVKLIEKMSIDEMEEFGLSVEMAECVAELATQICGATRLKLEDS